MYMKKIFLKHPCQQSTMKWIKMCLYVYVFSKLNLKLQKTKTANLQSLSLPVNTGGLPGLLTVAYLKYTLGQRS